MTYTAVPDVAEGDSWTAKNMNKYVRDNFTAGVPDIFTTKGDIAVATGNNAAVRLPVGTDGYLLIADSSETCGVKWALGGIALQSAYTGNSSFHYLGGEWEKQTRCYTEIFDNTFDAWDGTDTFTVKTDGYYLIGHGIRSHDRNATNNGTAAPYYFSASIYVNDAMVSVLNYVSLYDDPGGVYTKNANFFAGGFDILELSSDDYVELYYRIETASIGWTLKTTTTIMPVNIVMLNAC